VWISFGSTSAAIPTTSSTAATTTNSVLNPGPRFLTSTAACTGLSLASEVAAKGSLSFWLK
jgi:hypothetical protein